MKKLLLLLTIVAAVAFIAQFGQTQTVQLTTDGPFTFVNTNGVAADHATNNVAVSFTNTYNPITLANHDYVGVQLTFKGTGAATGVVQVNGVQSIDSSNYETTPSFSKLVTMNGTTAVSTNWDIFVPTGQTFKFTLGNTNSTVAVTNIVFKYTFKSVRVFAP